MIRAVLLTAALVLVSACSEPKVELVKVCSTKTQIVRIDGVLNLRRISAWDGATDTPIAAEADVSAVCGPN